MSPSPLPSLTLASLLIKKAGGLGVRTGTRAELLPPGYVQRRATLGPQWLWRKPCCQPKLLQIFLARDLLFKGFNLIVSYGLYTEKQRFPSRWPIPLGKLGWGRDGENPPMLLVHGKMQMTGDSERSVNSQWWKGCWDGPGCPGVGCEGQSRSGNSARLCAWCKTLTAYKYLLNES